MRRVAGLLGALTSLALTGCGEDKPTSPVSVGSAGGTGAAGPGTPRLPSGAPLPSYCQVGGSPGDSGGELDGGGLRLDVADEVDPSLDFELSCDEANAMATNLGCEFFAVDLPNEPNGTDQSPPAQDQQFAVAVSNPSGLDEAFVEVFLPGETISFAATTVPPGEAKTIELPPLSIDPLTSSDDGDSYRIVSDTPITAYQFNPLDNTVEVYSNDASLLIPTHALGNATAVTTGDAVILQGPRSEQPVNAGAFVSVVATVDDTLVEYTPTAALVSPPPRQVTLDRGKVLTLISNSQSGRDRANLSGTIVQASAPVAVFGGNVATAVPTDGNDCCADHLEHQIPPFEAWGSAYAVAPPPKASQDGASSLAQYKIVGAFDGTELLYCPSRPNGAPERLQAGQVATFTTWDAFTVFSREPSKTFSVTQFILSFQAIPEATIGDPGMLVVPAASQYQRSYSFVVPNGYVQNFATIVRPVGSATTLDGTTIDALWSPLGVTEDVEYEFAQIPVGGGSHVLSGSASIGLSVFGYDEAVSFAYPGGAGLRVISVSPVG